MITLLSGCERELDKMCDYTLKRKLLSKSGCERELNA